MASMLTRKRGRPFGGRFTPEERKARKRENWRLSSKERVHIGNHVARWNRLKSALGFMYSKQVAGYLLDRYENDEYTQKLIAKNSNCHRNKKTSKTNTGSTTESNRRQTGQTTGHERSNGQQSNSPSSKFDNPSKDSEEISNDVSLQLEVDDGAETIDEDQSADDDSTSDLDLEDDEEIEIKQELDSEEYTPQNSGSTTHSESSIIQTTASRTDESGGDNPSHIITQVKQEPVDNHSDSLNCVLTSDTSEKSREGLETIKTEPGSSPERDNSGPRTSSAKATPGVHPSVLAQNVPQNTVLFAHRIIRTVIPVANVASPVNTDLRGNTVPLPIKTVREGKSLYVRNDSIPQTILVNPQTGETLIPSLGLTSQIPGNNPLRLNLQGSTQIPGSVPRAANLIPGSLPRAANFTVLPSVVQRGYISSQPYIVTGGQQGMMGRQQTVAGGQQPTGVQQGMMGRQQTVAGGQQPTGGQQHVIGAQQPIIGAQPMIGAQQPTIGVQQPTTRGQQPIIEGQQNTLGAQPMIRTHQPTVVLQQVSAELIAEGSKLKRSLSDNGEVARTRKRFASVDEKETQEGEKSKTVLDNDTMPDGNLNEDDDDTQSEADDFDDNLSQSSGSSDDTDTPSNPASLKRSKGTDNLLPGGKKKRFTTSTEEEINQLFEARQTYGTKKNTTWGCKMMQDWSRERRGEEIDFENVSPAQLNKLLEKFYCEARPEKDGQVYHKNTLTNLRAAINRKLGDLKRNVDIVKDKEFRSSNGVLAGLFKVRAREGIGVSMPHREIIEKSDLEKMASYFKHALLNPIILRQCVYFHLTVHFICRAHDFRRDMKIDSFTFISDDSGEYVNHEIRLKGVKNAEITIDKRMYTTDEVACPVKMLKLLIAKTDNGASALFNNHRKDSMCLPRSMNKWYRAAPLTQGTMSRFMKDISRGAGLSRDYSGQSLRDTAIQHLTDEGFEAEDILYMTGYKNRKSLMSNHRRISSSLKRSLSCSLSNMMKPSANE
ncbi:uncharacterized protein LOC134283231 [Saccostrea cucullata]|uniref:uncharacterized protein LOC134283231 n=1 Tax=Saccostrea cuccullata TaxID=36930 RepID=UPI002ED3FE67